MLVEHLLAREAGWREQRQKRNFGGVSGGDASDNRAFAVTQQADVRGSDILAGSEECDSGESIGGLVFEGGVRQAPG